MWKNIPNWEEYYKINEYGEVKNKKTGNLISGDINNCGYHRVTLYHTSKKQRFFRHRLVAELFIPNLNHYKEINHKDGNKSNNHISNLEWCDRTHNERECRRLGLKEYKPFQVIYYNGKLKNFEFTPQLAEELGVTKRTIMNYLQGKSKRYKNFGIKSIRYIKV